MTKRASEDVSVAEAWALVLATLRGAEAPMTPEEIERHTGLRHAMVADTLRACVADCLAEEVSTGKWVYVETLPDRGPELPL